MAKIDIKLEDPKLAKITMLLQKGFPIMFLFSMKVGTSQQSERNSAPKPWIFNVFVGSGSTLRSTFTHTMEMSVYSTN